MPETAQLFLDPRKIKIEHINLANLKIIKKKWWNFVRYDVFPSYLFQQGPYNTFHIWHKISSRYYTQQCWRETYEIMIWTAHDPYDSKYKRKINKFSFLDEVFFSILSKVSRKQNKSILNVLSVFSHQLSYQDRRFFCKYLSEFKLLPCSGHRL